MYMSFKVEINLGIKKKVKMLTFQSYLKTSQLIRL